MAITKETIIMAAVTILNRDGIDGLSMRTLAKSLGIQAASLYWHFAGKAELYGAISEHLCMAYEVPEPCENAKEYLMRATESYRAMLLKVRDAVAIFSNSVPETPRRLEIIHAITDALQKTGVQKENLFMMANLMNNYVLSFVADEIQFKSLPPEGFDAEMFHPYDKRSLKHIEFDTQFRYGLQVLFSGMEAVRNSKTS